MIFSFQKIIVAGEILVAELQTLQHFYLCFGVLLIRFSFYSNAHPVTKSTTTTIITARKKLNFEAGVLLAQFCEIL